MWKKEYFRKMLLVEKSWCMAKIITAKLVYFLVRNVKELKEQTHQRPLFSGLGKLCLFLHFKIITIWGIIKNRGGGPFLFKNNY